MVGHPPLPSPLLFFFFFVTAKRTVGRTVDQQSINPITVPLARSYFASVPAQAFTRDTCGRRTCHFVRQKSLAHYPQVKQVDDDTERCSPQRTHSHHDELSLKKTRRQAQPTTRRVYVVHRSKPQLPRLYVQAGHTCTTFLLSHSLYIEPCTPEDTCIIVASSKRL